MTDLEWVLNNLDESVKEREKSRRKMTHLRAAEDWKNHRLVGSKFKSSILTMLSSKCLFNG